MDTDPAAVPPEADTGPLFAEGLAAFGATAVTVAMIALFQAGTPGLMGALYMLCALSALTWMFVWNAAGARGESILRKFVASAAAIGSVWALWANLDSFAPLYIPCGAALGALIRRRTGWWLLTCAAIIVGSAAVVVTA